MRVLAIVNLKSGQAASGVYDYLRALGAEEGEIVLRFVGSKRTIASMVEDARDFDRVVAVGGDGTVSGVCYALRDTGVPIVVYPAGTANLTAINLRVPTDPVGLADMTVHGSIRHFDMGEITLPPTHQGAERRPRGFVVAAGAGFDAKIMESAKDLKPTLGVAGYLMATLQNLAPEVAKFRLTLDGEEVITDGIAVLVVNFARLQFDIPITHKSEPDDGLFEVVVLRTRNAVELLPAVWARVLDRTTGIQTDKSLGVDIHQAKEVEIHTEPILPIQYDGEVLGESKLMHARMLPGATSFVTPE